MTADDQRVVSASSDKTLRIWDLESGEAIAVLEGHAASVDGCAVTTDGKYVVSASVDDTLKVWDVEGARAPSTLDGHVGSVNACAMTANSRRAVSASSDRVLKVWDLESGHVLTTLQGHSDAVQACAITADGQRVVSASHDRTLKVWDIETGRALATLRRHADSVRACAVTPDGWRVVSASDDRTLKVWDIKSGRTLAILEGHAKWVLACTVTADGERIVSASADGTLKVWDFESEQALSTLEGHTKWVLACAVADSRRVVSASEDGTLKVWDLESGRALTTLEGHVGSVNACAVTPEGRYAISASEDRTLKVWDLEIYACVFTYWGNAPYTAVTATAAAIIAGDDSGAVWVLDWPASHRRVQPLRVGDGQESPRGSQPPYEVSSLATPLKKHIILFLAANPIETDRLALDREARAIQVELERSGYRDRFELVTHWAAEPLDLLRGLRKLRPTVVHFSGHGSKNDVPTGNLSGQALHRDIVRQPGFHANEPQHGLFFHGPDGRAQLVSTAALEDTFDAAGSSVKLVVLSGCYSELQADALLAHVSCVVGMRGSIRDDAARSFAIGFYGGLGERESVAAAYKQGCAAISLEGLRDDNHPQLRVRNGLDADRIFLAVEPW